MTSHPLLCETVTGRRWPSCSPRATPATAADMVELRLDGVADLDVAGALPGRRRPVIVTCRPAWEGGRFDGSEEERQAVLPRRSTLGAEYVDVEWRAGFDDLIARAPARASSLSSHDFDGVPRGPRRPRARRCARPARRSSRSR